jgi:hypothetical protein
VAIEFDDTQSVFRSFVLSRVTERVRDVGHTIDDYRPVAPMLVAVDDQVDTLRVAPNHLRDSNAVLGLAGVAIR